MREIKFRIWDGETKEYVKDGWTYGFHIYANRNIQGPDPLGEIFEQFTGLRDRNGLTDIYEGDIVSITGEVNGNIHERHDKRSTDIVITGMGTKSWRDTEQEAGRRGCFYAE